MQKINPRKISSISRQLWKQKHQVLKETLNDELLYLYKIEYMTLFITLVYFIVLYYLNTIVRI